MPAGTAAPRAARVHRVSRGTSDIARVELSSSAERRTGSRSVRPRAGITRAATREKGSPAVNTGAAREVTPGMTPPTVAVTPVRCTSSPIRPDPARSSPIRSTRSRTAAKDAASPGGLATAAAYAGRTADTWNEQCLADAVVHVQNDPHDRFHSALFDQDEDRCAFAEALTAVGDLSGAEGGPRRERPRTGASGGAGPCGSAPPGPSAQARANFWAPEPLQSQICSRVPLAVAPEGESTHRPLVGFDSEPSPLATQFW
ncbi:hypothetical protein EDD39_7313 [Kitasatospora cineracea]|uniref:Uncharacterized protein n=1 Tax=Kitasatospora cineracea TaxID=88074 RepID=A0A8G1X8I8_9ACTN|nr:hypothetical protein EDD39_7313 [Kitasatospora cineracea]